MNAARTSVVYNVYNANNQVLFIGMRTDVRAQIIHMIIYFVDQPRLSINKMCMTLLRARRRFPRSCQNARANLNKRVHRGGVFCVYSAHFESLL